VGAGGLDRELGSVLKVAQPEEFINVHIDEQVAARRPNPNLPCAPLKVQINPEQNPEPQRYLLISSLQRRDNLKRRNRRLRARIQQTTNVHWTR
jgi:hypothetical protein